MKKDEFFPKVEIVGQDLIFNTEALETMELDHENATVVLVVTTNVVKKNSPKEVLIMKTNGSSCDDVESIKDVFPPDHLRPVSLEKKDDEIISGKVSLHDTTIAAIKSVFGDEKNEFKLLVCNTESPLGKEFKEQFDIANNYYKFAYIGDKRVSIGKDKAINKKEEERISIN